MSNPPLPFSPRAPRTADHPLGHLIPHAGGEPRRSAPPPRPRGPARRPAAAPAREMAAAGAGLLARPGSARAAPQYGTTQGYAPLRERLLARTAALDGVSPREVSLTPDDVVVTTGSQQLLYLLSELLL